MVVEEGFNTHRAVEDLEALVAAARGIVPAQRSMRARAAAGRTAGASGRARILEGSRVTAESPRARGAGLRGLARWYRRVSGGAEGPPAPSADAPPPGRTR